MHRVIVRRALRPTPRKAAEPFASQGAYGRLRRLTFVALLRRIALGSAGRPGGCRRPLHACVAQARRTLAAPVHPGLLAPACRDRRQARRFLACLGGGDAFSLCAAGAKEAGRTHGSGPWPGGQPRAVGMVLGAWRHRGLAGGNGRQRDAALGHERLPQEHSGGMTPSAGVSALALLIAWRQVSLMSPERTWGARQPPSRGERRARCAAGRGGQRLRQSHQSPVSVVGHPGRPGGKEVWRARVTRWGRRTVAPTRRRQDSTSCAQARMVGLGGRRGVSVSRGLRRIATWCSASGGSALARRGGNAARDLATVSGWTGKSTRPSAWRRADPRGPCVRSRPTAIGCPLQCVRRVWPQAFRSAGLWARRSNSRGAVPAAWRQTSCCAAAQPRPPKAAKAAAVCGFRDDLSA
jgi:hypothetical protein